MRLRAVHQFVATLATGDAIGNDAVELQTLLWRHGVRSDLFADVAFPDIKPFVRDWRTLVHERAPDAALLVHHSMGNDVVDDVATLELPKAVVYHNITPARFFEGISEEHQHFAELGRQQLRRLAEVSELGIGDSEFNRAELVEAGFAKTAVVPILLDESAYATEPDQDVLESLGGPRGRGPRNRTDVLVVGQILPQKAIHDVVAAFARYRKIDPTARLHLVGPQRMSGAYLERIRAQIRQSGLGGAVALPDKVSQAALLAYYRGASVLLTLSDHEGFCVPLLEAMRFDLPIVAHAAGAIPETLGDAGLLLREKSPEVVAAALERAVRDDALRADLAARGRARLAAFAPERVAERLRAAFADAGWELAAPRRRTLAVVSGDHGASHDHARALCDGLRAVGHGATHVAIKAGDRRDLARKTGAIPRGVAAVLIDREPGAFPDGALARALFSLWRRQLPVILSLHELAPESFAHFRRIAGAVAYRPRHGALLEALRVPWVGLRILWWFARLRAVLALMGGVPRRIVLHSDSAAANAGLLTRDLAKVDVIPLANVAIDGVPARLVAPERLAARYLVDLGV